MRGMPAVGPTLNEYGRVSHVARDHGGRVGLDVDLADAADSACESLAHFRLESLLKSRRGMIEGCLKSRLRHIG